MKILIVYYSRTNTTKKVAQTLALLLRADVEEIICEQYKRGVWGYLQAGKDASLKRQTKIGVISKDLSQYDLTIVGTPVWSFNVSAPIRTFLTQYRQGFKQVAFFLTCGGNPSGTFSEMSRLVGLKAVATLELRTKEVWQDKFEEKLKRFAEEVAR